MITNSNNNIIKTLFKVWLTIAIVTTVSIWLTQNSINAYWQQTYHRPCALEKLAKYHLWYLGGNWGQNITNQYANLTSQIEPSHINDNNVSENKAIEITQAQGEIASDLINESPIATITKVTSESNPTSEIASTQVNKEMPDVTPPPIMPSVNNNKQTVTIKANDIVFFAGDSLMQGVAPFVEQSLKKKYGIKSINLSKQSTGLSYPKFFDWPTTIEKTLQKNPQIKLLVVFLGPNDPWDFPDPEKSKAAPYVKFASDNWERIYRSRINKILQSAFNHNVEVIWLNVPYMRSDKLNSQMLYLNSVISKELQDKIILLPTHNVLSNSGKYSDYITQNGKQTMVRSKDGIHFTSKGQLLLAEYILNHISYQTITQNNQESNTELSNDEESISE